MSSKDKKKLPVYIILAIIAVLVAGTTIYKIFLPEAASTQKANLSELYSAEKDTAAIIVNGETTNVRAVIKNQNIYLRLGLVTEQVNSHFYYEPATEKLYYTTADDVIVNDKNALYEGVNIFYNSNEGNSDTAQASDESVYVLLSYIAKYTNIQVDIYSNPYRVFIRSRFGNSQEATALAGASLRTQAKESAAVITTLKSGDKCWVISQDDGWCKVYIGENYGYAGYISDEELTGVSTVIEKDRYTAPTYNYNQLNEKICLVWDYNSSEGKASRIKELLSDTKGVNVVSPTWFSVEDSDGNISSRANQDYVDAVHDRGAQVWALVENFNTENTLDYSQLLGTATSRENLINSLIEKALKYEIDGINVDFEGLPASAGYGYRQFIRELSIACRKNNLVISVACYVPSSWTAHYYREDIAECTDYFIIMAYDEHYEGSDAGSTASLSFVKEGIEDTIEEGVDVSHIVVGVPFYSRLWKGEGVTLSSSTVNMDEMLEYMSDNTEYTTWDSTLGQYYIEKSEDGILTRLWVENARSLEEKITAIKKIGDVAGLAGWRLGNDNAEAWEAIGTFY